MGMFDWYIPDPPLRCPLCQSLLENWQGFDGVNALAIWKQGIAEAIDQAIEDPSVKVDPTVRAAWRLPPEFHIHAYCSDCYGGELRLQADCTVSEGTWMRTELPSAEIAVQRHEKLQRSRPQPERLLHRSNNKP
jgi:hypothetical protein